MKTNDKSKEEMKKDLKIEKVKQVLEIGQRELELIISLKVELQIIG